MLRRNLIRLPSLIRRSRFDGLQGGARSFSLFVPRTAKPRLVGLSSSPSPFKAFLGTDTRLATDQPSTKEEDEYHMRCLMHFCQGFRNILVADTERNQAMGRTLDPARILPELRRLYAESPSAQLNSSPESWAAVYLSVAFQYEMEYVTSTLHPGPTANRGPAEKAGAEAAASVLENFLNLAVHCAEEGLLSYHHPRKLFEMFEPLGVKPPLSFSPPKPTAPEHVTPWTLFNTTEVDGTVKEMVEGLTTQGYAVVDNVFGPVHAAAIAEDCRKFIAEQKELSKHPGNLDRGDRFVWLEGAEGARGKGHPGMCVGALTQFVRTRLLLALQSAFGPQGEELLKPPEAYMAHIKLVVHAPGSIGHPAHKDLPSDGDSQVMHLVYYLNKDWVPEHGGQLVLTGVVRVVLCGFIVIVSIECLNLRPGEFGPDKGRHHDIIEPVMDRLVVYWSGSTLHQVLPLADVAPPRLSVSFWYRR